MSKIRTFVQSPAVSVTYDAEDAEALLTRATELLNLLKLPTVAQFALTPSADISSPRSHRDTTTSLPLAVKTTSRLLAGGAGPGRRRSSLPG